MELDVISVFQHPEKQADWLLCKIVNKSILYDSMIRGFFIRRFYELRKSDMRFKFV